MVLETSTLPTELYPCVHFCNAQYYIIVLSKLQALLQKNFIFFQKKKFGSHRTEFLFMVFVLRESWQSVGLLEFDAEDVIGLSSPYRRTAERSSAAKKPHIKNGETRRFPRRVSSYKSVFEIELKFELPLGCGFCSAQIPTVQITSRQIRGGSSLS